VKTVDTSVVQIWIGGDEADARRFFRLVSYKVGLCVTVTRTTFVYTGGEESGLCIGFVNYPRFPTTPEILEERALSLVPSLIETLCQRTALVVGPTRTTWVTIDPPGAAPR